MQCSDKIYCYCDTTETSLLNVRFVKMFVSKVHEQKLELLRAVFRNMYLKEQCDYLDSECKMLADHIVSSQLVRAEKNETVLKLKKDLSSLKQRHEEKVRELARANEQVVSMSLVLEETKSSLDCDKSIDEDLHFKDEKIRCLQDELVQVRLQAAEKWAEIRDLQQIKSDFQQENERLRLRKPESVSRLQEQLITAKLLQIQHNAEFDNVKKQLGRMKHELEQQGKNQPEKEEGDIQLYKNKGAFWKSRNSKRVEEERVLINIEKLEEEKISLEQKIPEIESKINIINKHIRLKEEERCKFQEKLNEALLKHQTSEKMILERKKQCDYLEKTAAQNIAKICDSCSEKDKSIEELSSKLQKLSERKLSKILQPLEVEELNALQILDEQILALQQRVEELNSEIDQYTCREDND